MAPKAIKAKLNRKGLPISNAKRGQYSYNFEIGFNVRKMQSFEKSAIICVDFLNLITIIY